MGTEIASLFARIGADVSGLATGLTGAKNMLTSTGQQMRNIGMGLTMGLTVPLAGVGIASGKAATDLDAAMRNIQSISKQSDESLAGMQDTFVAMSTNLNVTRDSAVNLASGFYQIQSSGFAGADAMAVLEASTKAASAGLTTTEISAKGISAILNAYSMNADQATRVSDVMFKAVDIGVFSFGDLSNAIGDTLGTASAAQIPIEQIAAGLATMTKSGINVNEATTSMNQMLLSFISPSDGAADAAAALGLEFNAAHLAAVGLPGMLQEIQAATGGNIEAMAELFPNVRALRGALSLMRGEGVGFASDLEAITNSAGSTTKAFEIQNKSWSAQFDNLKNQAIAVAIPLGQVLVPIVIQLLKKIMPLVNGLKKANPQWVKWALSIGGVLAAAGPVIGLLGTLGTIIGALASPVGLVVAGISALGAAFVKSQGGIGNVVGSFKNLFLMLQTGDFKGGIFGLAEDNPIIRFLSGLRKAIPLIQPLIRSIFGTLMRAAAGPVIGLLGTLGTIIGALASPVGLVVAGISALGAAFVRSQGGIGNVVSTLKNLLEVWQTGGLKAGMFAKSMLPFITTMLNVRYIVGALARAFKEMFEGMMRGDWQQVGQGFMKAFAVINESVVPLLQRLGQALVNWITTTAAEMWPKLLAWGQAFLDWIGPMIPPLLTKLGELAGAAWAWITEQVPVWWARAQEWGAALIDWIQPQIPPLLTKLGELAEAGWQWILEQVPTWYVKLLEWGTALIDWIKPQTEPMLGKLGELLGALTGWIITDGIPKLAEKAEEWGEAFAPKVGPALGKLLTSLGDWLVNDALPGIAEFGVNFASALTDAVQDAWGDQVADWTMDVTAPLQDMIINGINALVATPEKIKAGARDIGRYIVEGINEGVEASLSWLYSVFNTNFGGLLQFIKNMFGISSPSDVFDGFGRNLMAGLAQGITGAAGMPQLALAGVGLQAPSFAGGSDPSTGSGFGEGGGARNITMNVYVSDRMDMAEVVAYIRQALNGA